MVAEFFLTNQLLNIMTERVQKLIDFFKNHKEYVPGSGIYSTRNLVGDPMDRIYNDGEVRVDICYGYDYIEIFGLTDDEFHEAAVEIDSMNYPEYFEED